MSCPNIAWARRRAEELKLPALTSWLFVTIAEFVDSQTLVCRISQSDLAEKTRMSLRQVNKLIPDLVSAGCIMAIDRGKGRKLDYSLIRFEQAQGSAADAQTCARDAHANEETYAQGAQVDEETYAPHAQDRAETHAQDAQVDGGTYARCAHLPTHHVRTKYPLKYPLSTSPPTESVLREADCSFAQKQKVSKPPDSGLSTTDFGIQRPAVPPWQPGDRRHPANAPALPAADPRVTFDAQGLHPEVNGSMLEPVVRSITEAAEAPDGIYPIVNCTPLIDLLCEGYDPDLDICPVIRRIAARGHRGKPMGYYATAIRKETTPSWKRIGTWGPSAKIIPREEPRLAEGVAA